MSDKHGNVSGDGTKEHAVQRRYRPLVTLVFFTLLGPIIGAIALFLAVGLWSAIVDGEPQMLFAPLVILHPIAIVFAMGLGAVPAFLTGLLLLLIDRRLRLGVWHAMIWSAAIGFVAAALWLMLYSVSDGAEPWSDVLPYIGAIGAVSAVTCRWLTWRWRPLPPPMQVGASPVRATP